MSWHEVLFSGLIFVLIVFMLGCLFVYLSGKYIDEVIVIQNDSVADELNQCMQLEDMFSENGLQHQFSQPFVCEKGKDEHECCVVG